MEQPADSYPEIPLSPAALREWERHVEHVMRGVAHALNNRAASVSAVLELSVEPDQGGAPTRALLAAEVKRLRDLADVVRTVGSPRGQVEAFAPADAATAAQVILSLHAELRERSIAIDASAASPVRARRWLFVRALVALAHDASAQHPNASVTLCVKDENDWVAVSATVSENARPQSGAGVYVREAAAALGGGALEGAFGFRVPSLASIRRREGR